jgi:hypothetical protein
MNSQLISRKDRIEDMFESHAFELALSWALFFFGIRALLSGLHTAPGSVQSLPVWLAITYCLLATIGGVSVIFGIWCKTTFSWAYGFEVMGLIMSASAWASYILGSLLSPVTGKSTLLILALIALVIGCLLRTRAILRRSNATMVALRHASPSGEEDHG